MDPVAVDKLVIVCKFQFGTPTYFEYLSELLSYLSKDPSYIISAESIVNARRIRLTDDLAFYDKKANLDFYVSKDRLIPILCSNIVYADLCDMIELFEKYHKDCAKILDRIMFVDEESRKYKYRSKSAKKIRVFIQTKIEKQISVFFTTVDGAKYYTNDLASLRQDISSVMNNWEQNL